MSSRKPSMKNKHSIAIVGLAALYPNAHTPQTFWQNLKQKNDARGPLTAKKLNAEISDYQGQQGQADRFYCDKGGYIQDFHFDPSGYHIAAKELVHLDDSLKWALHTCSNALKDANIALNESALAKTGIIMGTLSFPTEQSNHQFLPLYHSVVEKALQVTLFNDQSHPLDFTLKPFSLREDLAHQAQQTTSFKGQDGNIAHNASKIISEALSLKGPQLSLDAACASSVYSLKLACDYLHTHKADIMLAGAVSGADPFFINMGFSIFHAYPEHGSPKNEISAPFDTKSQGLFAGEGAGVLVLKRLEDAIRDNDHIYALIDSIGLSNDGKVIR